MSLRLRILLATAAAVLIGLLLVDALTYTLVTRSQLKQVDDTLLNAHIATEQFATGDPAEWPLIPDVAPGLFVAILDPSGTEVYEAAARGPGDHHVSGIDLDDVDLRRRNQTVAGMGGDDRDADGMRLRVEPLPDGSTLIVGQSLHEINETQQRLLVVLLAASGAAVATVMALAWWLIRVGLRPLERVEASAAAITDSDLGDARVPGDEQQTEVGRLARSLNAMLDRLDTAREEREQTMAELTASEARMRQFVADASHELRTPMAATAAYAELFEQGARDRPADLERSMTGIRTETARMAELVDDLLLLARLDEQRPLAVEPVDLTEVVLASIEAARTMQPDRVWTTQISEVVTINGDGARLRQVVDNLLTNVRTHVPVDAATTINLSVDADHAVLVVKDEGPGVSDEQLDRLGDRFYRVDEARTRARGGSGLGLSIAAAIVGAHNGRIAITHNEPHGLVTTVRIPIAPVDDRNVE